MTSLASDRRTVERRQLGSAKLTAIGITRRHFIPLLSAALAFIPVLSESEAFLPSDINENNEIEAEIEDDLYHCRKLTSSLEPAKGRRTDH